VVGSSEYGDKPSGSGTMELKVLRNFIQSNLEIM
jgi:hypothetical protein